MCKENSPTNVNSPAVVDVKNSNNNETRKLLQRQIWISAILADILKQRDEVLMSCLVEIVNLKRERHSAEVRTKELFAEFYCLVTGNANKWHWQVLEDHEGHPNFNYLVISTSVRALGS